MANKISQNRWMWGLYVVVGCFIVCLLIWIFMEITKDEVKQQEDNPQQVEQTMSAPSENGGIISE